MNPVVNLPQCASSVLMIRPAAFGFNPDTRSTNRFQTEPREGAETISQQAVAEFDALVRNLRAAGVAVVVVDDQPVPHTPDALFPNNWVSTHADGTVVLYPMCAPNRRSERREDIIDLLVAGHGFEVRRVIDLAPNELRGRYLEGTGSVVFDHSNRMGYACLSERTDRGMLYELEELLAYRLVVFHATDALGVNVYHTNVVMSIGECFAVVCAEAIDDEGERDDVVGKLEATGRDVIRLTRAQMSSFSGNVLELRSGDARPLLAASRKGWDSLAGEQQRRLEKLMQVVLTPIPTIEAVGGGSVRCMIAEIFLRGS